MFFIPTLYFAEGLVYILVNSASVIMYKKMGVSNALIGLTSFLYLPWVIKMFWGPAVDRFSTKRRWILGTQAAVGALLLLTGLTLHLKAFFALSLLFLTLAAFASATHDIAADGFYMLALDEKKQAFFVGFRSFFYRLAMLFGTGVLVVLAGRMETRTGNIPLSWFTVFAVAAGVYAVLALYHKFVLPRPASDQPAKAQQGEEGPGAFRSYFQQPGVVPVVFFILFYRFGESLLLKMVSPFLLDGRAQGGLGLTTAQVGFIYGTTGLVCLMLGGITGGWVIARFGIRKCLWPMVFCLHLPDLFYIYMAHAFPSLPVVTLLVAGEQFGYGFGFTAFTVILMYFAKGRFKTSHFAISTGIMAIGMMVPGMVSGYLQEWLGYFSFFLAATALTLPGIISIFFLPKEILKAKE